MRTRALGLLALVWIVRAIAALGVILIGRAIVFGINLGYWEVGWIVLGVVLLMPFLFVKARLTNS